jgi:predicted TIM-barrel fold metal-dependent hydrolase
MEHRLITTDCHIAPPYSLVEELPESYREHFPRLDRREDGAYVTNAFISPMMGASAHSGKDNGPRAGDLKAMIAGAANGVKVEDDPRVLARTAVLNVCPEAEPSFDPAEQLADLERDGVYGAVLIGRISVIETGLPAEVDVAYCEVVNDWLADTWGPYLDRVAPGIYLPYKDVNACVKEIERCAAKGMRPALLPDGIFERPYHLAEWEPLWEAANSLEMPITMHVGGLRNPPQMRTRASEPAPGQAFIGWYNQCVGMGETLGWLTYSGVFDRYPDLHVIMTEGYAAWLGFAIQFFDHHWSDSRFGPLNRSGGMLGAATMPKIEAPPSYYLKRQAHATFMWDPLAINNRHVTGLDCLLWGNDYPHMEGSFPYSQEWVDKQFVGVPEDEINQMVQGNAARIFNITI